MAQDNEYVQELIAARDREVAQRRDIAEVLAEKHNRGDTENMREAFIKIQDVIEAIERAVWHEKYIAGQKSQPFSPFGFGSWFKGSTAREAAKKAGANAAQPFRQSGSCSRLGSLKSDTRGHRRDIMRLLAPRSLTYFATEPRDEAPSGPQRIVVMLPELLPGRIKPWADGKESLTTYLPI
jgi:hypothetical protein